MKLQNICFILTKCFDMSEMLFCQIQISAKIYNKQLR